MSDPILSTAMSRLMLEHPYFAMMAGALTLEEDSLIATVAYRGDQMFYNPEYIEALTMDERMSVLAHAAMGQALFHTQRSEQKYHALWQRASAYAINDLLMQNGFILPPMALYSTRFERLYTEQIYAILDTESEDNRPEDTEEQTEENLSERSAPELITLVEEDAYALLIEQVLHKLEKQGEVPQGLERLIPQAGMTQLSWRMLLYQYITTHARSDYRMFPSNKKHLYRGVALPSVYGETLEIAVAIDTSASVDEEVLEIFLAELAEIMQLFTHYSITLIECDATIQRIQTLTPTEPLVATLLGGGGTDFRPVFSYLEEQQAAWRFLIYFTDGQGSFPDTVPSVETLWVLSQASEVPFGEKITIEKGIH
jgi:predicted metal-dependent peptidase